MASARPALLPLLFFVAGSLCAVSGIARAATLLLALLLAGVGLRRARSFDRALVVLGACLGLLHGESLAIGKHLARGEAALVYPVLAPFARSWEISLAESPKAIDPGLWRIRSRSIVLEVPVRREADRAMLSTLRAGDRVRVWARVRYDERDAGLRGRIKSPQLIEPLEARPIRPRDRLQRRRDSLGDRLRSVYGHGRVAGFLSAVLLGDRTSDDPEGQRRLRSAGLSHLVAISGLHVGVVAGLLLGVARRVVRRAAVLWILATLVLVGFGFMVGWGVPVQRAVGGLLLALAARAIGRDGDALNRLACIAWLLAWFVPAGPGDAAFALSFAATAGILLAGAERFGIRMSCGAYLATAPLCAFYFGQLAPWAPAANLLALPFVTLLLVAGYASLLFASVPFAGAAAASLTTLSFHAIERIAEGFDALPASPWFVSRPTWGWVLVVALAGLVTAVAAGARTRRLANLLLALGVVVLHLGSPPRLPAEPEARLLDVGQGQALVWSDQRRVSLIDSGGRGYGHGDPGAAVVRPALLDAGVRRLDRLVLSHGDADHAKGAFALLESIEVGELWVAPGWWKHERLADLAARARRRGTAIRLVRRGAAVPGVRVIGPPRAGPAVRGNAGSIALLLGRPPWTLFVPGDLDGAALARSIDSGAVERASALVLAHHGSRQGTTAALLDRVRPDVALVSCGWRNRFGHPHPAALAELGRDGIPLWRTDHHGTITLSAGREGWEIAISPRSSRGTR